MEVFRYSQARTVEGAVRSGGAAGSSFIAGGTTLVDLMKLNVLQPRALVDINGLASIVKPSVDAIDRSPLTRNSRPITTTTIHGFTTCGLNSTSAT